MQDRGVIPIHELLTRVRWDPVFAAATFELGVWDRFEGRSIRVPLASVSYSRPDDETFSLVDAEGRTVHIPFHRIRQVYRDGVLIWNRDR